MIKRKLVYFLVVMILFYLFVVLINGCATGPAYPPPPKWTEPGDVKKIVIPVSLSIEVNSEPPGAKVYVDDAFKGITPITVNINEHAEIVWRESYLVSHDGTILETKRKSAYSTGHYTENYTFFYTFDTLKKITVYKEGYKRQEKHKPELFDEIRKVPKHWKHGANSVSLPPIHWTAFLEADEKPFRLPVEVYPPSK